jgi:hypothetical protein
MRTARFAFRLFVFRGIARLPLRLRAALVNADSGQGMAQQSGFRHVAQDNFSDP